MAPAQGWHAQIEKVSPFCRSDSDSSILLVPSSGTSALLCFFWLWFFLLGYVTSKSVRCNVTFLHLVVHNLNTESCFLCGGPRSEFVAPFFAVSGSAILGILPPSPESCFGEVPSGTAVHVPLALCLFVYIFGTCLRSLILLLWDKPAKNKMQRYTAVNRSSAFFLGQFWGSTKNKMI